MDAVSASVIIPTFNRSGSLGVLLESLSRQGSGSDTFEVVVVDDGSTDATGTVCSETYPFQFTYVYQENQGSAAARNSGARQAAGEVLIFLDDDMTVEKNYVEGLVDAHRVHEHSVAMGILRRHRQEPPTPFSTINVEPECRYGEQVLEVDFTACVTNNLSVKRYDFSEIGGMESIANDGPAIWGDVAFGYRAWKKGYRFRRVPTAFCTHRDDVIRDLPSACARAQRIALLAHQLIAKYPEIRGQLPLLEDKEPFNWRADPIRLTARKLLRIPASSTPALRVMMMLALLLEHRLPLPTLLRPLYRWTIGGHLYRGYRRSADNWK